MHSFIVLKEWSYSRNLIVSSEFLVNTLAEKKDHINQAVEPQWDAQKPSSPFFWQKKPSSSFKVPFSMNLHKPVLKCVYVKMCEHQITIVLFKHKNIQHQL